MCGSLIGRDSEIQTLRPNLRRASLTLAALALSVSALTVSGRSMPNAYAAAPPTIAATIHDNWAGINSVPANLRYEFTRRPHYTLHVTGANFAPGASVKLAVLRVDTLQVIQRGSTSVQSAYIWVPGAQRSIPNPRAGTFDYKATVGWAFPGVPLRLWSSSSNRLGTNAVTRT